MTKALTVAKVTPFLEESIDFLQQYHSFLGDRLKALSRAQGLTRYIDICLTIIVRANIERGLNKLKKYRDSDLPKASHLASDDAAELLTKINSKTTEFVMRANEFLEFQQFNTAKAAKNLPFPTHIQQAELVQSHLTKGKELLKKHQELTAGHVQKKSILNAQLIKGMFLISMEATAYGLDKGKDPESSSTELVEIINKFDTLKHPTPSKETARIIESRSPALRYVSFDLDRPFQDLRPLAYRYVRSIQDRHPSPISKKAVLDLLVDPNNLDAVTNPSGPPHVTRNPTPRTKL